MTKVSIHGTRRWGGSVCTPAPSLLAGLQQGPRGAIAVPSPVVAPERSPGTSCYVQHRGKIGHCDCTASSPAPGSPCSHRQRPFACSWPRQAGFVLQRCTCAVHQGLGPTVETELWPHGLCGAKCRELRARVRDDLCVDVICLLHKLPLLFAAFSPQEG